MANKPIFFDATGRRARRLTVIGWVLAVLTAIVFVGFSVSLALSPPVTGLDLPGRSVGVNPKELARHAQKPGLLARAERLATAARTRRQDVARARARTATLPSRVVPAILQPQHGRSLAIGFYVNWGESGEASYSSLKRQLQHLDWVVPSWLMLDGPALNFKINLDRKSLDYIRANKPGVAILPVLQNASMGRWYGPELAKLLADPVQRAALLNKVVAFLAANKLQGVTVDFEDLSPAAHKNLKIFLSEMSQAFAPHGWIICQTAPFADDDWPYQAYADIVDYTMLMAYDQNYAAGTPGPITSQDWFEQTLDRRMAVLAPDSTIIVLGSYGYDWLNNGPAYSGGLSFEEAMGLARDAGAEVQFDPASNNPHFTYREADGDKHDIWFLDGATAFNQIHAADSYQPAGYGLWRLGSEDPSVLPLLGQPYNQPAPRSLRHIPINEEDIDFENTDGEVLQVEAEPQPGQRELEFDRATGDIDDETYTELPTNYLIRRVGALPKKIALTFDDGPDPEWTPQILAILKAKHVPATFFMIGENMEANPGLVQRVLADGHEIGNHTYTHPNLADTSLASVRLELNATQRLFEALTGRSMRLLRPPYLGDAEPTDAEEIVPIEEAQRLGYITVGTHIDTLDWQEPSVDEMMRLVEKEVHARNETANIVLMHDSGGDRSQTVKLLPVLIDRLGQEGYSFVPVSVLAGFTRDEVMPPLPLTVALYTDRLVFLTLSYIAQFLYNCFLGAIVLGVGRLFLLVGLALWKRMRGDRDPVDGPQPTVTVLIPAFNEEKVIVITVERILASNYPNLEVLVIDDGSKDHTAYIVTSHFMRDPRVGVISIANSGKAHALNVGMRQARGDVIVALDADTQFNPDTIGLLVRWFADPLVGAVAGNAKVGNRVNMITRWQALEYIVAQNLERRALSALDTLTVVPGAVGAWRREALMKLGGFPVDTLAEDQDLTIAIQMAGYRVQFDSAAIAWTEAPATVRGLAKQRFRWAFGTLQCLWKYRGLTFNPRYRELGMVALPQVWLFQIILTTLAPVADLLLVWQLVSEYLNYLHGPNQYTGGNLKIVAIYYLIFVVVDLLAAMVGFVMEKGEDWRLLWWLVLQRFGYRQIMYYVVLRSIFTAARGPFVGWGTLERQGTVKAHTKN